MLMQNFKSAADLGITEPQLSALQKTLVLFETGKLHYSGFSSGWPPADNRTFTGHFNMATWGRHAPCGTVACIGGTAEMIGDVRFSLLRNPALHDLFEPSAIHYLDWVEITPAQAATALRSYLTTGDAKWSEAV